MKKGKNVNIVAGALDIVFALGLFALIGLFYAKIAFVQEIYLAFLVFFSKILYFDSPQSLLEFMKIYHYFGFVILGITGLLSLTFGSITIYKSRKSEDEYYKSGKSFSAFIIFEIILLTLFTIILAVLLSNEGDVLSLPIIIPVVLFAILVLRFVGIGLHSSGKKILKEETPVAK